MTTFDSALDTVVRTCEGSRAFSQVERACIVRDLRGRVRLVLTVGAGTLAPGDLVAEVERALETNLGSFFEGPVVTTSDPRDRGRLAALLLEKAEPLVTTQPPRGDGLREAPDTPNPNRWYILERRLSRLAWLQVDQPLPPWPLTAGTPPIVAFYSFKGGVGRTTALVSCAWQLARLGKRVAILDLDLEAPGLGSLLEAEAGRGLLDVVVDFLATESVSLADATAAARALGPDDGARVDVLPAGRLNLAYIEKLARLDFAAAEPWGSNGDSPVARAFREVLLAVKRENKPDYILLDARAGLSDLSGILLRGLSHVDVLVSRATEQAYQGLQLSLDVLARGRPGGLVVVHAFAPRDPESKTGREETEEFRDRVYRLFEEHLSGDEPPGPDDETAYHWPWPLAEQPDLARFSSLSRVESVLFSDDYRGLLGRIEELCTPPAPEEEGP